MTQYTIDIELGRTDGTLAFEHGNINVSTRCWWNLSKPKLKEGSYGGIKTNMASSGYRAIWLPDAVGSKGKHDIFIHSGSGPSDSQGCIVIRQPELARIWLTIQPPNIKNISVRVTHV